MGWSVEAQAPEAWFLPGGSGAPTVARFPFIVLDIVALPDRFVAIGVCAPEEGCRGPMLAIGQASEVLEVPDPTLPED